MRSLAAELRAEGGLLAGVVSEDGAAPADELELVIEAIREGYLQHYGEGQVVCTDDRDLALLAGDRLYALGLARLAERGDLRAVAILADLIAECAQAHAEQAPARADQAWADATARLRSAV
jgi:hypothetical protein